MENNYRSMVYHSDGTPYINNSLLSYASDLTLSDALIDYYLDQQEGFAEKPEKKSFQIIGSAIHKWLENPNEHAVMPETMPAANIALVLTNVFQASQPTYRSNVFINALKEELRYNPIHSKWPLDTQVKNIMETNKESSEAFYMSYLPEAATKIMLSASDAEIMEGVQRAVQQHEELGRILETPMETEKVVVWNRELSDITLHFKMQLDRVWISEDRKQAIIYDFKTDNGRINQFKSKRRTVYAFGDNGEILSSGVEHAPGSFLIYDYDRQGVFYSKGLKEAIPTLEKVDFFSIVFSKNKPYEIGIFKMNDVEYNIGLDKIRTIMNTKIVPYVRTVRNRITTTSGF